MKGKKVWIKIATMLLFLLANVSAWALASDAPMPGAIWTTDEFGHVVNGNVIYNAKDEVYLNGGPSDKDGTKLPSGNYYIQVTDPNGRILGTTVKCSFGPETYAVDSNGKFVAGRIQLYAATHFKDTTNSGNEYKVWISRDPKFSSGSSKTDNFKVKVKHLAPPVLEIQKFNDWNKDGIKQPDEPYVLWSVTITNITTGASWVQKLDGYGTGRDGTWKGLVEPGVYRIAEAAEEGWLPTTASIVETSYLDYNSSAQAVFGNRKLRKLEITKFYDSNMDGIKNEGESLLPWRVKFEGTDIWGQAVSRDIYLANGTWNDLLEPGTYTFTEYIPNSSWVNTTAISETVNLESDKTPDLILMPAVKTAFGNVCVGTGGGHTHGFWGNPNGAEIFNSDGKYLEAVNSLALVNENGTRVTPFADYTAYASWNQDATAENMAFMLSCQLAAMKLNITAGPALGFVDGNGFIITGTKTPIYVGGNNVNNGFISITNLMAAGNEVLLANPITVQDTPERSYQELLKNLLDSANNDNSIFVKTTPQPSPYTATP